MKGQNKNLEKKLFSDVRLMMAKELHGRFYNSVRKFTKIKNGEKILDVGCGTGVYGIDMAKHGGEVTGIDISSEAIDFANKWARREKVSFKGIIGDAEELPFRNNTFNLVFFGAILHHFPDLNEVFKEAKRVLADNGRLVLVEPNGWNPALRISRFLARFLADKYAAEIHATKNETIHTPLAYRLKLAKLGLREFKYDFLFTKPSHKKTITVNLFLKLAIALKIVFMKVLIFFPKQIGCEYFVLSAVKYD